MIKSQIKNSVVNNDRINESLRIYINILEDDFKKIEKKSNEQEKIIQ
jgi:hypothetical protein